MRHDQTCGPAATFAGLLRSGLVALQLSQASPADCLYLASPSSSSMVCAEVMWRPSHELGQMHASCHTTAQQRSLCFQASASLKSFPLSGLTNPVNLP